MRIKNRKGKRKDKKYAGQPGGCLSQNVCGLRAENILRHTATESRAQALAFRPLHENDQKHQQRDEHVNREDNID